MKNSNGYPKNEREIYNESILKSSLLKSTGTALLCWFFLGGFLGHRFYLGKAKSALMLFLLPFIGGILLLVSLGSEYSDTSYIVGLIGGIGFFVLYAFIVFLDAFRISGWVEKYNKKLLS